MTLLTLNPSQTLPHCVVQMSVFEANKRMFVNSPPMTSIFQSHNIKFNKMPAPITEKGGQPIWFNFSSVLCPISTRCCGCNKEGLNGKCTSQAPFPSLETLYCTSSQHFEILRATVRLSCELDRKEEEGEREEIEGGTVFPFLFSQEQLPFFKKKRKKGMCGDFGQASQIEFKIAVLFLFFCYVKCRYRFNCIMQTEDFLNIIGIFC